MFWLCFLCLISVCAKQNRWDDLGKVLISCCKKQKLQRSRELLPFLFGKFYLANTFCRWLIDKFLTSRNLFQNFWGSRSCAIYRLLKTVLFLTDSVFRVLFAYFDESMASKIVYKPQRSWNTVGLTPILINNELITVP